MRCNVKIRSSEFSPVSVSSRSSSRSLEFINKFLERRPSRHFPFPSQLIVTELIETSASINVRIDVEWILSRGAGLFLGREILHGLWNPFAAISYDERDAI